MPAYLQRAEDHIATLQERVLTLLPKFEMYLGETYVGCIRKEFSFFHPRFTLDCNGWSVDGEIFEWDYNIWNEKEERVATVKKKLFHLTDTYVIEVELSDYALMALMVVLAIDAENAPEIEQ